MSERKHYALAREAILAALTAYTGITTADGATPAKNTLICADLINKNDFISNKTILIGSGDAAYEDSGASSFNVATGEITVVSAFSAQIKAGVLFRVLNISTIEVDVEAINTKIGTNVDAAGTTTLFAWLLKLFEQGGQGLVYYGEVTTYTDITHFRISGLTGFGNDYFANNHRVYVVWDKNGAGAAPQGEMQPCSDYDSTDGIFTHTAFTAPLEVGDKVLLIHELVAQIADILADIATVDTVVDAIKVSTDKLAGAAPVTGQVTANWKTETGTSGEAGEDLVTIGANDTKNKLHSLLINVSALTVGAIITVKLFMQVHGSERKVYSQVFTVGTDTDGLWIVNGTVGIHEALRCEVYSDTDESVAIDYDYMLEAM